MLYRAPRSLSACEAAYLAGLIDGEGTVALTRRHRSDNRQLVVSISSTESAILDHVLHVVGAGRITRKRTYRANHAQSFTYAIANRQALELLRQISPYLKSYKAARTALVLARIFHQATPALRAKAHRQTVSSVCSAGHFGFGVTRIVARSGRPSRAYPPCQ
jgi:hypothetical protein